MTEPRDYYEVLGLSRDADAKAIKDAFRQLALKYHPDRNKSLGASDRFKEIAEAYAVLSDPEKRAQYDTRGHAGVAGFSAEDLFGGINFDDIFGGLAFDIGPNIFDRLFGRRVPPRRGADLEVDLSIPLERVLTGGEETVRFGRPGRCQACQGSGAKAGTSPRTCQKCGGSGQLVRTERKEGVSLQQISTCPDCGGRGSLIDTPCGDCSGTGQVLHDEILTLRIPVGVEEGTALRIPGHGFPAEHNGWPTGDLLVIVRTADDPRFERHGRDLSRIETIDVVDAVLGKDVDVLTLDGHVTVKIAPGTQPETALRLRGKGLPRPGGGALGDLYVRVRVHVPERLSERERRLFEELRAARSVMSRSAGRESG